MTASASLIKYRLRNNHDHEVLAYRTHVQCPVAVTEYDEEGAPMWKVVSAAPGDWLIEHPDKSYQVQCDSSFQMLYEEVEQ